MSLVPRVALGIAAAAGLGLAGSFAPAASAQSCDPAYVNYCIPSAWEVGDLDCPDMYAQGISWIQVDYSAGSDSHGFDGDYDGWGCEG